MDNVTLYSTRNGSSGPYPVLPSTVYETPNGTPYLLTPGVATLSYSFTDIGYSMRDFLGGYDETLHFSDYLEDPDPLDMLSLLCKVAGQLCYMSFGPGHTKNREAKRYFSNIKLSRHGSVLEHATVSLLLYGVSRSMTHEIVRHRAGFAYSMVSQRYVSGKTLRFVERPEYVQDELLHEAFIYRIDTATWAYARLTEKLLEMQRAGNPSLAAESRTDLRKRVQQAARSLLPNETEAPLVVTGNIRAWRHFIEMRASQHAEIEIRELAINIFLCLSRIAPLLFDDYDLRQLSDGSYEVTTPFSKV